MVRYRNITVERLGHACVRIETTSGSVIYTNPWVEVLGQAPHDADIVFVTNDDFDYYDPDGIDAVATESSDIVVYETIDPDELNRPVIPIGHESITVKGIEARAVQPSHRHTQRSNNTTQASDQQPDQTIGLFLTVDETTVYLPGNAEFLDPSVASEADVFIQPVENSNISSTLDPTDFDDNEGPDVVLPVQYQMSKLIRRLIQDIDDLKSEQQTLDSQLLNHVNSIDDMERTLSTLQTAVNDIENQTVEFDSQTLSIKDAIEHLAVRVANAADDSDIRNRLNALDRQLDETQTGLQGDINELQDSITHLESTAATKSELEERTESVKTSRANAIDELRSEVEQLQSDLESELASQEALEELEQTFEKFQESLDERTSAQKESIDEIHQQLDELQTSHQGDVNDLTDTITHLESTAATKSELEERTESIKTSRANAIDELRSDVEQLRSGLESELASQEALEELEQTFEKFQESLDERTSAQKESIDEIHTKIRQVRQRRVSIDEESVRLDRAVEQLSEEIDSIQRSLPDEEQLRDEIDSVRTDLRELKTDISEQSDRLTDFESKIEVIEALESRIDQVDDDLETVESHILQTFESIRQIVDTLSAQGEGLEALNADLERLEAALETIGPTSTESEELWTALEGLEQTKQRLKSSTEAE